MHVQQAIDEYVIWHEVSGHSAKTIAWYRWLHANGRSTCITEITLADVRALFLPRSKTATSKRSWAVPCW